MELVKDGINGVVKDFSRVDTNFNVNSLTDGILELLEMDTETLLKYIRPSVHEFQDSVIANQWKEFVNEL